MSYQQYPAQPTSYMPQSLNPVSYVMVPGPNGQQVDYTKLVILVLFVIVVILVVYRFVLWVPKSDPKRNSDERMKVEMFDTLWDKFDSDPK